MTQASDWPEGMVPWLDTPLPEEGETAMSYTERHDDEAARALTGTRTGRISCAKPNLSGPNLPDPKRCGERHFGTRPGDEDRTNAFRLSAMARAIDSAAEFLRAAATARDSDDELSARGFEADARACLHNYPDLIEEIA